MNVDQVTGVIRQFLPFAGGIATMLGWNKAGEFDALSAAILAAIGPMMILGSLFWSLVANKNSSIVTSASKVPGVDHVVLKSSADGRALAEATPSNVSVGGTASKPL